LTVPAGGTPTHNPAPQGDNPPWLFGLLSLPYGVFNNVTTILMPFLLRKHGVSVDRIAEVVAISYIPSVWYFLWSPIVDLGLRRRTWILIAAGVSALCGGLAVMISAGSLALLTALLVAGNAVVMLLSSANGAILTTLHPSVRGRASGSIRLEIWWGSAGAA
jgi:MFS family permease